MEAAQEFLLDVTNAADALSGEELLTELRVLRAACEASAPTEMTKSVDKSRRGG